MVDCMKMKKSAKNYIIGIGGIFFKSQDPEKLQNWYIENLGFFSQVPYMEGDDAITFKWKSVLDEHENSVWAPFKNDTTYFNPSQKEFMINYIVINIEELLDDLKSKGIKAIDEIRTAPYGKFASILDPEGNKIEFWEPNREFFKNKY